ncbi:MAG: UbiA family prenyltransferase [Planctomycetaceae bacterium]|nr:UbiA family prenyltransferase [Planctomycetaceae bacterium]
MMPWLRLMRLPTVFTALANVICGYLLTHPLRIEQIAGDSRFWLLLCSGAGLYLGGMVLNDVCDAELDRTERPERPIPSGQVKLSHALLLAVALIGGGVAAASIVGSVSSMVAICLAAAVFAYDAALKKTVFGPIGMATCRFLNILLGASAVERFDLLVSMPQLGVATALFVYIVGVTWFARYEAQVSATRHLMVGLLIVILGIAGDAVVILASPFPRRPATGALIALVLIAVNLTIRCVTAVRSGQPRLVQKSVGVLLLNIIFLDATVVFAATGDARLASLIVALVIPATLMKRFIPLS